MAAGSAELAALAALAVEPIGATGWDAQVRRWCEAALRAADLDPGLAARLRARLAQALMYAGDLAAADAASLRAIAESRQSPGGAATIAALRSRQLVLSGPEGTEIVYRRLLPYRKRFVGSGGGTSFLLGPVDLHLGIAERALGRLSQAVKSLREACRMAEAAGLAGFAAEARLELGIALRASESGEADAMLAGAAMDASRLGMAAVHRRAEEARSAASPLTGQERDVALLVAQGLSNRQIAQRLGLSDRTAQNHVQHILVKLGLANRVQIASWWRDQRLA